ncbi:hypothetical protein RND59_13375 [Vibrio ruber]|uniref:hypothetical protein n=1 Tax=Vibrio ruber TaxID=184755 RepID=UPI002892FEEC|nr:hypothetical protein [Vibrio ruber]WNJ95109.1 hypothetical protein RND59_13375 [Vibrio ruber]
MSNIDDYHPKNTKSVPFILIKPNSLVIVYSLSKSNCISSDTRIRLIIVLSFIRIIFVICIINLCGSFQVFAKNGQVEQVELAGRMIDTDAYIATSGFKKLNSVNIKNINKFRNLGNLTITAEDIDLHFAGENNTVTAITLELQSSHPKKFNQTISSLKQFKKISSLDIRLNSPMHRLDLSQLQGLKEFKFTGTKFIPQNLILPNTVKELSISSPKFHTNELKEFRHIQTLYITTDHLTFDSNTPIPAIQKVSLTLDNTSLNGIEQFPNLKFLELNTIRLTDYSALTKLKLLEQLEITTTGVDILPAIHNPTIQKLIIRYLDTHDPNSERYLGNTEHFKDKIGKTINNIDQITAMTGLKSLELQHPTINVTPLEKMAIEKLTLARHHPMPIGTLRNMKHLKTLKQGYKEYEGNELIQIINSKYTDKNEFDALIISNAERGSIVYGKNSTLIPVHKIQLDTYTRCGSNQIVLNPKFMDLSINDYMSVLKKAFAQTNAGVESRYFIQSCNSSSAVINKIIVH